MGNFRFFHVTACPRLFIQQKNLFRVTFVQLGVVNTSLTTDISVSGFLFFNVLLAVIKRCYLMVCNLLLWFVEIFQYKLQGTSIDRHLSNQKYKNRANFITFFLNYRLIMGSMQLIGSSITFRSRRPGSNPGGGECFFSFIFELQSHALPSIIYSFRGSTSCSSHIKTDF